MTYTMKIGCIVYGALMRRKNLSFSLIELMVVVAIVVAISIVAAGAYKDYYYKARMMEVTKMGHLMIDQIKQKYFINGTWPTTVDFLGVTGVVNAGAVHLTNFGDIKGFEYWASHSGAFDDGRGIVFYVRNLPVLEGGAAQSTVGGEACYPVIFGIQNSLNNTTMVTACGSRTENGFGYPFRYLPKDCQCTGVPPWLRREPAFFSGDCPSYN